nr:hypothetical protein [Tanacetum cinerariifolium]
MASEQSSSGPTLHEMTPVTISSRLVPNPTSSTPFVPPSRTDWDMLFQPLFDELLTPPPSVDHPASEVIALITDVVALEPTASTGSPSSTTVDQDAPSPSHSPTTPKTQSSILPNDVKDDNHDLDRIKEEQAAKARYWKIPACCDDDEDYNSAITPNEPVDSLSMGDEHLNTIPATESDEFIKSCVENIVPNPSESEGENGCDVLACFTTFSNILFDADYESDSSDYQSCSDEDVLEEIYSNYLFEEEIIPMKIDQHHFNAESDLIESMLNHDSSIIPSSSKIDSLLDEFVGELTLFKSISPGIDKTDCHPENEIHLIERLLYDNSSPRPPKEFVSKNSDADIDSFSPSPNPMRIVTLVPIPGFTITRASNQEKSPDLLSHRGFEIFQLSVKRPMMIHGKNIPILDVPLFHFYFLDQLKYGGIRSSSAT